MASMRELQQQLLQSHDYIRQLNQEVQNVKAEMAQKLDFLNGSFHDQATKIQQ